MQKSWTTKINLLAAGIVLLGTAGAQQTSTTGNQTTPPAKPKTSTTTHRATTPAKPLVLVTEKDKQSYAIGLNVGKSLHRDSIEIEPKFFLQGIQDALANGKVLLTDDQIKTVMTALQTQVRQQQMEKMQAEAATNQKAGAAFLAANATKEGVVSLPSGLQYKILVAGTGPKPSATDSVVCNYQGALIDNTEFDSSYKRGQPVTFPVSGVIKGWTEALQLMPVGSKWQLFIPPDLAYGERGKPPIEPNSTLVFQVELLSIEPKNPPAAAAPAATPAPAGTPAPATTPAPPTTPPPPATR
jgi:FKBP-type peptidyl-prolyl cis-trans isomerase FklB